MYAIKIVKIVDRDPEEIQKIRDRIDREYSHGGGFNSRMNIEDVERHREEKVLDVVLTDEEFKAVKEAVIRTM